jgi:two-component system response regulator YesN
MYKLLIVDDEQIVLDSVKFIVEKDIGGSVLTETARSGREAIEKAETFRPDIIMMDIKMPGISGLDAITSIKQFHSGALFIIITAYEKFDFAKEAINLGVIEYINKPLNRSKVAEAIKNGIRIKDEERKKLDVELELKEKMAYILPVLESGFIYSLIFSDDHTGELENYKKILDIRENSGYVMTIEFGEENGEKGLANKIGSSIKNQKLYPSLRDTIKESCTCIVGPAMFNRIITYVPCDCDEEEYEQRIQALDIASTVYNKFCSSGKAEFYIGIGNRCNSLGNVYKSYEESLKAIGYASESSIVHINDIPLEHDFMEAYSKKDEKLLFKNLTLGETEACLLAFDRIYEWARSEYGDNMLKIVPSLTELVVMLGRFFNDYCTGNGSNLNSSASINEFLSISDSNTLRTWMINRIKFICEEIKNVRDTKLSSIISNAMDYIHNNYCKDITLENVSKEVNVSPNYFSKLFKDETGSNFIDYLTMLRIEKAKIMLSDSKYYNKEICYQIGYSDPNYFSRIFKKIVGVTPTEFKSSFTNTNN